VARRIEACLIPGPAGDLEALLEEPEDQAPLEACLVCHPHPAHGGTMHNKVVYRMAKGLRRSGRVVLRFNFRGVGRSAGSYDHMAGELEDARSALAWLRARYPDLPYTLAGFSFGSRIIMRLGCATEGARKLIGVGFPTWREDNSYLTRCTVPKLFIQSTIDEFGPRPELEALFETMSAPKELHFIDAADHFFAGSLEKLEELLSTYPPASG
jgi:alpha/beta superfamily hydrolase